MAFDDYFDEDFELVSDRLRKKILGEIDAIFKEIKNGKLEGTWETKEIDEPGVKGWISMGSFGTVDSLEPLDPIRPRRKRPVPERPFELPKATSGETREPLTDVFEEANATTIYMELPGEEREDIRIKVTEDCVNVKSRNFHKNVRLPNDDIATERMTSEYKNGLLRITLPKKTQLRVEDAKKQKKA